MELIIAIMVGVVLGWLVSDGADKIEELANRK